MQVGKTSSRSLLLSPIINSTDFGIKLKSSSSGVTLLCFLDLFMTGSASGAHHLDRKLQLLQPVDADTLPVTPG